MTQRWTNPSLPQTLQIAVFLLYFNAVLGLLQGTLYGAFGSLFGLAAVAGYAAGGFGIANEKRWGYVLAVVISAGEVLLLIALVGITNLLTSLAVITFAFSVALVALLIHPDSRSYQRIWFK